MPPTDPPVRADYKVFYPLTTRWSDNDIYGHINNVVFYSYFDTVANRCVFSDSIFASKPSNFLVGGKLSFSSPNSSFDIIPIGSTSTPLVCIPSNDTDQVWGTVLQPSRMTIQHQGTEMTVDGMLLIETSKMSK